MTDPDTIAAFNANRAASDTTPDSIEGAVRKHIEDADGIPKTPLADVPTAPMRIPHDTVPNPFVGDDEVDEDAVTVIRKVPEFRKAPEQTAEVVRPYDPTHCMM